MIQLLWTRSRILRFACMLAVSLCASLGKPNAAAPGQRDFASGADAVKALVDAARAGDQKALTAVLGSAAHRLISSGDAIQDKNDLAVFLAAYDAKQSLQARGPGRVELVIGQNDWPLPIPIVESAGRWSFDSASGAQELINRRIGKNELLTIRTLLACAEAQQDYFARFKAGTGTGAYAQRILSSPGQTDGLYWDVEEGQPASPLGPLVSQAQDEGYPGAIAPGGKPLPYHGYFFRILKAQDPNAPGGSKDYVQKGIMTNGFALLAWPAVYGSTGVVTFIVGPDGVAYQKDLGPTTSRAAAAILRFHPDLSWARIDVAE